MGGAALHWHNAVDHDKPGRGGRGSTGGTTKTIPCWASGQSSPATATGCWAACCSSQISGDARPLLPSGDIEIGWHLHPAAWGNGYATEAAARGLKHAFDSGLDNVVAVTSPDNVASQNVARRIGMSHQGRTDRYYNATCELFTVQRDTDR